MCGIFAYVGKLTNASQIVLDGLKILEYRGYDSWGIATASPNSKFKNQKPKILIEKHVGKIGNAKLNSQFSTVNSQIAIGHTRWATHGGVSTKNAHPHLDCTGKIALLHNGIIENFGELKGNLLKIGHTFRSETDTEVAVHLIEEFSKKYPFSEAVRKAFNAFRGMNAIVTMHTDAPQIIAAKNGSPLVVGLGNDEFFLASDAAGIAKYTKRVLFLEDNHMVLLNTKLKLINIQTGGIVNPDITYLRWAFEEAEIGTYPHFMMKEIHEQPKVITNLFKNYDSPVNELAARIKKAHGTFLIAAGTAFHACLSGAYLFSKISKRHANATIASEFNYLLDFITPKSLVIALSQSGETIDVIEPLQKAKAKGATVVGITNSLGSTIYRISDFKVLLGAGPEKAVASTKAYIAKLTVFLLLAYALNGNLDKIKPSLEKAAKEISLMLADENMRRFKKLARKLAKREHIYVIGRGASYPSALEAALKIKEVSYIHTEGLAGGELKHGTIALIEKGTPVLVFAPFDETYDAIISNATEIKARGGVIIGISPKHADIFNEWIELKDLGDATYLTQIIPAQLLTYYLALEKVYDPDKPRNLAKSVTVK